jgi:hypothetical protein
MQDEGNPNYLKDETTLNVLWFVLRVFSTSVVVFWRHGFGEQFLGPAAVAVLIAVPAWVCVFPAEAPEPMLVFLAAYFGMVLVARASTLRRWWRGIACHSRYNGTPYLCALLPYLDELHVKLWIEPPLTVLLGLALQFDSPPLSAWLCWGGACLFIEEAVGGFWQYRHQQRRTDLLIENGLHAPPQRSPFLR